MRKPEILAPAGSMEALKAAVCAGADAVYLGGSRFGARAYADNFDEPALISAIEYCHLNGVKVYLTVNTLFRNEEMNQLKDYLTPLYEMGLDAVIVQDLGVMEYIHTHFPDLPIHASTQMTITTSYAYDLLAPYGVTRIVPARELSVKEIAALKNGDVVPELEVFVQGALCYCYSGQCLMSSFLGGRSGNRGRCAQPCRLPYQVKGENGEVISTKGEYLLSPKDLCGLEAVPDLIAAGVDSFKIEGRMKKPLYVAVCVHAYRMVVDAFFDNRFCDKLVSECKSMMAEVFNRGGFTKGYYDSHNGAGMMSLKAPGNAGVRVGKLRKIERNRIEIRLCEDVKKGDLLLVKTGQEDISLTCNVDETKGKSILLNAKNTQLCQNNQEVVRVHSAALEAKYQNANMEAVIIPVDIQTSFVVGKPASVTITANIKGQTYYNTYYGKVVETASKQPLTREIIREKLGQLGNTGYVMRECVTELSKDAFYSMKDLKEIKREAIRAFEQSILSRYRRKIDILSCKEINDFITSNADCDNDPVSDIIYEVSTKEQLNVVKDKVKNACICLDLQFFGVDSIIEQMRNSGGCSFRVAFPYVMRENTVQDMDKICECNLDCFQGVLVRNLDTFSYLKKRQFAKEIVTDYCLYSMNQSALQFYSRHFSRVRNTLSVELNENQAGALIQKGGNLEQIIYGFQPLMISAQCVCNTVLGCRHSNVPLTLEDRLQKEFPVQNVCRYCYNIIYNSVPTVLYDMKPEREMKNVTRRLHFTIENGAETAKVLDSFLNGKRFYGEKTRGHYKRGVE